MGRNMNDEPLTAADYTQEALDLVKSACLTVAENLGGLMDDIVIIGGSVPALLIDLQRDPDEPPDEWETESPVSRHVGTVDLDIGFALGLLDEERYKDISKQLRHAGFRPCENKKGNATLQKWCFDERPRLEIDFLIPPTEDDDQGGRIKHLEDDFAAIIAPGLELAFEKPVLVTLEGKTLRGAEFEAKLQVCSPAAFMVLKGLAIRLRGKDKDEYDIYYMLRNHPDAVDTIAAEFARFIERDEPDAIQALQNLRMSFETPTAVGPVAVSRFLFGVNDEDLQANASAFVLKFTDAVAEATK